MTMPLLGKTALITGASRGIGRAVALALAGEGARLVLTARQPAALEAVAAQARAAGAPAVLALPADLAVAEEIRRLAGEASAEFGAMDILVNNAGVGYFAPVTQLSADHLDAMLALNLRAPFLLSQALLPGMQARQSGHIVNISSVAGKTTFEGGAGYCASKWGLQALTETLIQECKPYGIWVTVVSPGSVQTEFGGKTPGAKPWSLLPEDVAGAVLAAVTARPGCIINEVILRPQVPRRTQ